MHNFCFATMQEWGSKGAWVSGRPKRPRSTPGCLINSLVPQAEPQEAKGCPVGINVHFRRFTGLKGLLPREFLPSRAEDMGRGKGRSRGQ